MASLVLVSQASLYQYLFSLTTLCVNWFLVLDVLHRPRHATRSGHDVTGTGFDMDLPKAKACLATRFCSTDVAADCRPSEKQAAAGQLAGGGAMNSHEAGHCAASSARGRLASNMQKVLGLIPQNMHIF